MTLGVGTTLKFCEHLLSLVVSLMWVITWHIVDVSSSLKYASLHSLLDQESFGALLVAALCVSLCNAANSREIILVCFDL